MARLVSLVLGASIIVLGLFGCVHSFRFFQMARTQHAQTVVVPGVVIGLERQGSKYRGGSVPVVRFFDKEGTGITFKGSFASHPPKYRKGQKVAVAYNPFTKDAKINSSLEAYGLPIALLSLSFLVVLIGFAVLFEFPIRFKNGGILRGRPA